MALAIALSFDDDVLLSLGVEGNNGIAPTSRQSLNISAAMPKSMRPVVHEEIYNTSFTEQLQLALDPHNLHIGIDPATAVYTTPFTEQLQLALDPHNPNLHIDLGMYRFSWENGKNQWSNEQRQGFRKLTRDELVQLMRRLLANPNVILLNLMRQGIDGATMREMAAAIAALSELQVLLLVGA